MPAAKPPSLAARLKGGVFAFAGLCVVCGAVAGVVSTRDFLRTAARAPGIVTRLNAGGFHPEIQFTVASGQRVQYPQGGMIKSYHAGESVFVLYDPHHPGQDPRLDTFGALWMDWITLFGMGAVFIGIGSLLIFGKEE